MVLESPPAVLVEGARTGVAIANPRASSARPTISQRTARIDIWRSHWATLEPVVPEIHEYLKRTVIEFEAGGPLGHQMWAARSTYFTPVSPHPQLEGDRVVYPDAQLLPQGLIPGVRDWLEELGYRVETRDHREDSERWVRSDAWKRLVAKGDWKVVEAVAEHTALRVVLRSDDRIADAIAAVARAYPAVAETRYADVLAPRTVAHSGTRNWA